MHMKNKTLANKLVGQLEWQQFSKCWIGLGLSQSNSMPFLRNWSMINVCSHPIYSFWFFLKKKQIDAKIKVCKSNYLYSHVLLYLDQ